MSNDNDNEYYTVIRVKRKYIEDPNCQDRYDSSVTNKRLRHIGSFSQKHDEISLNSQNLLKKMGFKDRKRIRFNDFDDDEQFSAYINNCHKYDDNDDDDGKFESKKSKQHNCCEQTIDENDILNISLPANDSVDLNQSDTTSNENDNHYTITCNGQPMITVNNSVADELMLSRQDKYLYDYYILMDDLMEFVEQDDKGDYDIDGNKNNTNVYDDEEPSSNDENYRYNDYPDEDGFTDDEDKDDDDDYDDDDDDDDDDYKNGKKFDEFDEYEDEYLDRVDNLCDDFDKLYRHDYDGDSDTDDDDDDDDEDYDREYAQRIMNLRRN
ncbi:hypothetical protein DERF_000070 [Dermatophagoides farinae]|uniref:RNA polymerase II nuclear localization protein SLC7A6OS n=2 Tax=Dermatophagoides farinae TaxID=6954 RepID=A0A922LC87_DERFA|nr:hypothetical protein DERF_000070 [Dermatophagoides farinae]